MRHLYTRPVEKRKRPELYSRVVIKVILKDGSVHKSITKAGNGHRFPPQGVQERLDRAIEWLDTNFPKFEFRMVQVGPAEYNFVYEKDREQTPQEEYDNRVTV